MKVLIICVMLFMAGSADAGMIRAIIGESSNQSIIGQTAVACAIKNRQEGLQGVYGARMTRKPTGSEIRMAEKALTEATPDVCRELVSGADMFCSDLDVCREPWQAVAIIFIVKIEDHWFYRRLTERKK